MYPKSYNQIIKKIAWHIRRTFMTVCKIAKVQQATAVLTAEYSGPLNKVQCK